MELFSSDFSQATATTADEHDPSTSVIGAGGVSHHLDTQQSTHGDANVDSGMDLSGSEPALRGKAATQNMTQEEKKERQRQQNRRAAERSRYKKREELTALEMTVNNIQDENQRLRSRLAALLASKTDESSEPHDAAEVAAPAGIDYTTLAKLQTELATAKDTLMQRELELATLQGTSEDDGTDDLRSAYLSSSKTLQNGQYEVKALHSLIGHLRSERDGLARQRDMLSRELEARRALREVAADGTGSNSRAVGVERALLDLRGLVDGVIRNWEQTSILPLRRPEEDGSDA